MQVQLSEAEDPWGALEKLRRNPESLKFVYMLPYRKSELSPLNPYRPKPYPLNPDPQTIIPKPSCRNPFILNLRLSES